MVKSTLSTVYQVSTETHCKKVFEQSCNSNKPDQWLAGLLEKFSSMVGFYKSNYQIGSNDGINPGTTVAQSPNEELKLPKLY